MERMAGKSERIKAVDKAFDLFEFLSRDNREIGISEISKSLHMGLSTVHRIITTLRTRSYVTQNPMTMKYRLGIKLFTLGYAVQSTKHLVEITKPYLRELTQLTSETSNLAVLEGKEVIYIAKIDSPEILTTNIKIGTEIPAHCTALGKTLLAFISDEEFESIYKSDERLSSLTSNSISSLEKLKETLKTVKEHGFAIDEEEYKVGVNCIGAPIFDGNGIIAALSVSGPASRFTREAMGEIKDRLMSISKEISEKYCKDGLTSTEK